MKMNNEAIRDYKEARIDVPDIRPLTTWEMSHLEAKLDLLADVLDEVIKLLEDKNEE